MHHKLNPHARINSATLLNSPSPQKTHTRTNSTNLLNKNPENPDSIQPANLQHGNLHSLKKLAQKFAKKMGGASAHFKKTIKDSAMLASIRGEKRMNLNDIGGSESESETLSYSNLYAKVESNSSSDDTGYNPPPPDYIPDPPSFIDTSSSEETSEGPPSSNYIPKPPDLGPSAPTYLAHPPAKFPQSAQAFLVINQAIQEFSDDHVKSDGIFRLSGEKTEIDTAVNTLAAQGSNPDLKAALSPSTDTNMLPGLMKSYLKAIPGGLILNPIRDELLVSVANEDNTSIKASLKKMAPESYALLKELTDLMGKIVGHTKVNQMTYSNLGIAMGNSLFNPDIPMADIMRLNKALPSVIEYIAENRAQLFE